MWNLVRETLEMTRIPTLISDNNLRNVVRQTVSKEGIEITPTDIEDCHHAKSNGRQ